MKFSSSFTVVMKTSSLQLPSLAGTLSIKSMLQSAPKHVIFILKIQKFSGRKHSPLGDPSPSWRGTPPPPPTHPSAPAAPRSSRLRRSLTHPATRKSGYGPEYLYWNHQLLNDVNVWRHREVCTAAGKWVNLSDHCREIKINHTDTDVLLLWLWAVGWFSS